ECDDGGHTCDTNAACENTSGSYECTCKTGYEGDGETCEDIDECASAGDNECHNSATCQNEPGTYACECNDGYEGDGESCVNVDECLRQLDNCHEFAECTDLPGSFRCDCLGAYVGDGVTCGCRQKSAENVLAEGGFNDQSSFSSTADGISAWEHYGPTTTSQRWEVQDADDCPDSGSMRFWHAAPNTDGNFAGGMICANLQPDTEYHFGFKYKRSRGGNWGCQPYVYDGEDCSGDVTLRNGLWTGYANSNDTISRSSEPYTFTTGATEQSVRLVCQT